jgi:hypothetical protein
MLSFDFPDYSDLSFHVNIPNELLPLGDQLLQGS